MNIPKAIELLSTIDHPDAWDLLPDDIDAHKLGIEALKRVLLQRNPDGCITPRLLPGETET